MPLDLANPGRTIEIGVILMAGETEILDVAPIDLLYGMSDHFVNDLPLPDAIKAQALSLNCHWVNEKGDQAKLTSGITLQCTVGYVPNESELAFIRKAYGESSAFLTICGGFDAALRAGLFEGKTVTAPRFILDSLRQRSPNTTWVERRWANDGKLWTSGTLLNGLDLMRAFAEQTWPNKAEMVGTVLNIGAWPSRDLEYRDVDGKL